MDNRTQILSEVARRHGTPCFVYFMDEVHARVELLRSAFEGLFGISYAMKCNPHPRILERVGRWVDGLDVSSRGELRTALAHGFSPEQVSFTGPAKQRMELELAVACQIREVVVESVAEAQLLDAIARTAGRVQRVLVRVAPRRVPRGFGVNMAGRPSQFGIDEEELPAALPRICALSSLELCGFHIYSGTQCLKIDSLVENYRIFCGIFRAAAQAVELAPRRLIFGSGLGVPYHEGDQAVALPELAQRTLPALRELKSEPRFENTKLLLETGRYLIGEAGVYLTRVVNRKRSRGTEIAICDGGMHHHLGACGHLGMVLPRSYRMVKLAAPSAFEQPYDLYGPLCTSIDVLGRGVKLPGLEVGDVLGVCCSGAYGVTASPGRFISHDPPAELVVEQRQGAPCITLISGRSVEHLGEAFHA